MQAWLSASKDFRRILLADKKNEASKKIDDFLKPVSINYYSPLGPIFLHQIHDVRLLQCSSVWLARDGLIPLLWFFKNHPVPPRDWTGRVLIHFEFMHWIPRLWRNNTAAWRLKSTIQPQPDGMRLLLLGLMTDAYCSLESLEKQLRTLRDSTTNSIISPAHPPAHFLTWKNNLCSSSENYHMTYLLKLAEYLGPSFTSLAWHQFIRIESFNTFHIVDLCDRRICADNFLVHHALSYGAALFDTHSNNSSEKVQYTEYFPISPYHGFEVGSLKRESSWPQDRLKEMNELLEFESNIFNILGSNTSSQTPWPESLMKWGQI